MLLAHVSDLHLDGTQAAAARAGQVAAYLRRLRGVDAVLVSGDLADHGTEPEYQEMAAWVRAVTPLPVLLLPGNHDVREAYRKVLLDQPASGGPINVARMVGDALFVLLDSSVPGEHHGWLDDETLMWCANLLAGTSPATPVYLCLHHPPVHLHMPYVDDIRLINADRLAELIGRHRQVRAVLCGHAHTAASTTFAGVPLLVAPAVRSAVRLGWEPGEEIDLAAPASVAFHVLDDAGALLTHVRVVPVAPLAGG